MIFSVRRSSLLTASWLLIITILLALPAVAELMGKVTDSNGTPIAGVKVARVNTTTQPVTGPDGMYTVTGSGSNASFIFLAPGNYTRKWVSGVTWTTSATTVLDVVMPTIGTVRGTVRDARTLAPISGATISVGANSTTSGMDGTYALTGVDVAAGPVTVNCSAVGYNAASIASVYPTDENTANITAGTFALYNPNATNFNLISIADVERVYVLHDGLGSVTGADAMLNNNINLPTWVDSNWGGFEVITFGRTGTTGAEAFRRAILKWNVAAAGIPANAWVKKAIIYLRAPVTGPLGSGRYYGQQRWDLFGYAVENLPWQEGSGLATYQPVPGCTWNAYDGKLDDPFPGYNPLLWSVGGEYQSGDPLIALGRSARQEDKDPMVLEAKEAATRWLAGNNTGILIKHDETITPSLSSSAMTVASREHPDGAAFRPVLKIWAVVPPAGQGVVHGVVTDSVSGDPLAGVTVDFGTAGTATTDYDGSYYKVLNAGTVSATATLNGYSPQTLSSITVPNGGNVTANLAMTGVNGRVTYVFQDGVANYTGARDTSLVQVAGASTDYALGYNKDLKVGNPTASLQNRSVLKFNVSKIPTGANILSAKLTLTTLGAAPAATLNLNAHKVTEDWVESSVYLLGTAVNNDGASWFKKAGAANNWTTAGGTFDSAVAGTLTINTTDISGTQKELDLTSVVAGWVTDAASNFGILIKPTDTTVATAAFRSRDSQVVDETLDYIAGRPRLVVVTGSASSTFSSPADFAKAGRWNLVSVPADPVNADPLVVFSGINVADASFQYWKNNTEGGGYQSYGAMFGWTGPIERGTPYWFLEATATVDKQISFEGMAGSTDFILTVPSRTAAPFWIMFGTPFNSAILADDIRFKNVTKRGDTWLTWEQAFSEATPADRIVDSNAQGWSAADNRFVSVTPTAFIGEYHQIEPWWGYWLLVYDAGELLIKFPKP